MLPDGRLNSESWEELGDVRYRCRACRLVVRTTVLPIRHNCPVGLSWIERLRAKWRGLAQSVRSVSGLGDLVALATLLFGIKPCRKCRKRRDWLNRLFRFHGRR